MRFKALKILRRWQKCTVQAKKVSQGAANRTASKHHTLTRGATERDLKWNPVEQDVVG